MGCVCVFFYIYLVFHMLKIAPRTSYAPTPNVFLILVLRKTFLVSLLVLLILLLGEREQKNVLRKKYVKKTGGAPYAHKPNTENNSKHVPNRNKVGLKC